jgi:hypothetical protein
VDTLVVMEVAEVVHQGQPALPRRPGLPGVVVELNRLVGQARPETVEGHQLGLMEQQELAALVAAEAAAA